MSDLRERVARDLANDMGEVVEATWKFYLKGADIAIAICMEEAARVAEGMWWQGHGNLATEPYAAAAQAGNEIAAAIRALAGEKKHD